jgi:TolB-like protein
MSLFAELKRRNVLRVAAAYIAVSWLLIQVVETLFPVFDIGDTAVRAVVIVLALGFIPAVAFAWAFELTPEGLVRDGDVDHGAPQMQASARRLDRLIIVALVVAVAYFAIDKFMLDPARDEAIVEAAREEARAEAAGDEDAPGRPVIAVLPFTAVTSTEDSAFFAAGVHDDLLTKLAQLPSMLVISRTSVMEYKDVQRNMRAIGDELGADALLEGGVQTAGNRIRINAQLIDAKTDEHLWAETYDRELTATSIFDVQDDIARAIADALHITLAQPDSSTTIPTSNMAAYRAYHEAVTMRNEDFSAIHSEEYQDLMRKAAELDPKFTRPLADLAGVFAVQSFNTRDPERIAKVEELLEKIRLVAPGSVDHLIAQTYYTYYVVRDYDLAHQFVSQAIAMMPSDMYLLEIRSWIERRQGDYEAMLRTRYFARQLEPTDPRWTELVIFTLFLLHRYDDALAELAAFENDVSWLARFAATMRVREHGDLGRFVDEVIRLPFNDLTEARKAEYLWNTYIVGRDFASAAKLLPLLDDEELSHAGVTDRNFYSIITYKFLGQDEKVREFAAEIERELYEGAEEYGLDPLEHQAALTLALLEALAGDTAETGRLIRQYQRAAGADWAHRSGNRDQVCQALALGGAAAAAVDCIRDGIEEPSVIMPFFEPLLPYYDGIREEPVFVELVDELEDWEEPYSTSPR